MLADKPAPHGQGMLAVLRARFLYPAFEHLIADQPGAASSRNGKHIRKYSSDKIFHAIHHIAPLSYNMIVSTAHRGFRPSGKTKKPGPIS
jgi:hypothetical protein